LSLLGVDVDQRVAIVTLDDPERRNVLSLAMVDEIVAAFDALEDDTDVGAVIVTGAPPAFCAGADLSHLAGAGQTGDQSGAEAEDQSGLRSVYDGFLRVARSSLPTVAAVNGPAVGAGMNLALACDVRMAARSARFDTRFLKLGLHPGGGHTWMLRRLAGAQTAAAMVLFGEVLGGAEAVEAGLAWRCVDDNALLEHACALAAKAAEAPPALVRRAKETIAAMAHVTDHDEAVQVELTAQLWSLQQPEFAERLAAMRERISRRS
jgi:enoyl-CoA hydratase